MSYHEKLIAEVTRRQKQRRVTGACTLIGFAATIVFSLANIVH